MCQAYDKEQSVLLADFVSGGQRVHGQIWSGNVMSDSIEHKATCNMRIKQL